MCFEALRLSMNCHNLLNTNGLQGSRSVATNNVACQMFGRNLEGQAQRDQAPAPGPHLAVRANFQSPRSDLPWPDGNSILLCGRWFGGIIRSACRWWNRSNHGVEYTRDMEDRSHDLPRPQLWAEITSQWLSNPTPKAIRRKSIMNTDDSP
jgi:hypothetical protein